MSRLFTGMVAKVNTPSRDGRRLILAPGQQPRYRRHIPVQAQLHLDSPVRQFGYVSQLWRDRDSIYATGTITDLEVAAMLQTRGCEGMWCAVSVTWEGAASVSQEEIGVEGWQIIELYLRPYADDSTSVNWDAHIVDRGPADAR